MSQLVKLRASLDDLLSQLLDHIYPALDVPLLPDIRHGVCGKTQRRTWCVRGLPGPQLKARWLNGCGSTCQSGKACVDTRRKPVLHRRPCSRHDIHTTPLEGGAELPVPRSFHKYPFAPVLPLRSKLNITTVIDFTNRDRCVVLGLTQALYLSQTTNVTSTPT